jgi:hypothetical protein
LALIKARRCGAQNAAHFITRAAGKFMGNAVFMAATVFTFFQDGISVLSLP